VAGVPRFFLSITMTIIPILLNEPFFAVINKPAGLFTQASPGIASVETVLREQWQTPGSDVNPFVGLPHRLDRGTSGALIVARNQRALQRLSEQFHSRKVQKRYLAVVQGRPSEPEGTWLDYVRKIPERPVAEITTAEGEGAKQAELGFKQLASESGFSLLEIELKTGRMHQIRIQAASRGLSVVGDWCYGNEQQWGDVDDRGERTSLALHAAVVQFHHPQNAKAVRIAAPLPTLWEQRLPPSLFAAAREYVVGPK
jgi:23S rRNA pseudouridine1911/1915/1917 synthase